MSSGGDSGSCGDELLPESDRLGDVEDEAKRYSKLFVFSGGHKAGMESMDKEKQARVIYEMSKDSAFFKRATKMDQAAEQRAASLLRKFQAVDEVVNPALYKRMQHITQQRFLDLEKRRNFDQICCVLDMDMFYAAVEIRDAPHLRDLPVAVGGNAMISTSNYVARQYGVRAAMPGFIAKKLCPQLVFVRCNFNKYKVVAEQIRGVIGEFDPHFRSHSLDEVYFDLTEASWKRYESMTVTARRQLASSAVSTGSKSLSESDDDENENDLVENRHSSCSTTTVPIEALRAIASQILQEIRSKIFTVTGGLTSSAGMANNFFLAKICADVHKPNGQFALPCHRHGVLTFLNDLSTRKVGGIGKVTEKILCHLGMNTMGQVREQAHRILHTFTPVSSEFLLRVSMGIGQDEGVLTRQLPYFAFATPSSTSSTAQESPLSSLVNRKSISCERTYSAKGIDSPDELFRKLHDICERVSKDMAGEDLYGKTVTVKVKDTQFNLHTRCQSSNDFNIRSVSSIESLAKSILMSMLPLRVRLLGVNVSKFKNGAEENMGMNRSSHRGKRVVDYFRAVDRIGAVDVCCQMNASPENDAKESTGHDGHDGEEEEAEEEEDDEVGPLDMLYEHEFSQEDKDKIIESTSLEENGQLNTVVEDASVDDTKCTVSSAPMMCPICSESLQGGLIAINDHIDDCLAGRKGSQRASLMMVTRGPPKRRKLSTNSIHSYFTKDS